MGKHISIAVVSDPHFCPQKADGTGSESSHIVIEKIADDPSLWNDLKLLVDKEGIKCDLLLCPGDITTHAHPEALKCAWHELITFGDKLGVNAVAVATGNHDVMSRPKGELKNPIRDLDNLPDPFESLRLLNPPYPLRVTEKNGDEPFHRDTRIRYFGADFVIYETDVYRLVIFNSCSRHTNESTSYERGFIAQSTLTELSEQLKICEARVINILVCHHHPIPHDENELGLYDLMKNGDTLLKILADHGDWIVIHGHKHHGRIKYSGGTNQPVIFSAGSVGAVVPPQHANGMRNQFYVMNISLPDKGLPTGTLKVWNWSPSLGWEENLDPTEGLSSGAGFGEHRSRDDLATLIADTVGNRIVNWCDIEAAHPWLHNLPYEDFERMMVVLESNYQLKALKSGGRVQELGPLFRK